MDSSWDAWHLDGGHPISVIILTEMARSRKDKNGNSNHF